MPTTSPIGWRDDRSRGQHLELILRRVRNDPRAFNALNKTTRQRINKLPETLTV